MNTYKDYYAQCVEARRWSTVLPRPSQAPMLWEDVGVNVNSKLVLPSDYETRVGYIAQEVSKSLEDKSKIITDSPPNPISPFAIKLNNFWHIDSILTLGQVFTNQLENLVYDSYAIVDHIHIYRNLPCSNPPLSSWQWHYDDAAYGQLKLMIYLSDVNTDNGPFEYVNPSKYFNSSRGSAYGQAYPGSRIPQHIIHGWEDQGSTLSQVVGKRGTYILFNQNCVHRATTPTQKPYRDVIIYNFRPYHKKIDAVSREHTHSWDYSGSVKGFKMGLDK